MYMQYIISLDYFKPKCISLRIEDISTLVERFGWASNLGIHSHIFGITVLKLTYVEY